MDDEIKFIQAESEAHIESARSLFKEYSDTLGLDLCFQNFQKEVAELPGGYAPPDGRLLLAFLDEQVAGCVALRKIEDGTSEMKRLYVKPEFRGKGIGRKMAVAVVEEARRIGYARIRLDTLPSKMAEAIRVYRWLGFREIGPYYSNPFDGVLFMELSLQ